MYVDQFSDKDMSRDLSKKYGFTIYNSLEGALTLGGKELAVDGVLCIGEHGKYRTMVIDPSLYQWPVTPKEWLDIQRKSGSKWSPICPWGPSFRAASIPRW